MAVRLGIDIGGSGIKGAPVDLESGTLTTERVRIKTPRPSHPEAVAGVVRRVVGAFPDVTGAIGCTFPAIVLGGRINSAANVDPSWIGTDADRLFSRSCGRPTSVVNDADAAGVAEFRVGAAAGRNGVIIVLTLGTGIGSALLHDGRLVPNTELGHLELLGTVVETGASNRARKREGLSFEEWTDRLNAYLAHLERIFSPDLFVIGGGISKRFGKFGPMLRTRAEIVPAALRNDAGIVGAAPMGGPRVRFYGSEGRLIVDLGTGTSSGTSTRTVWTTSPNLRPVPACTGATARPTS